PSLLLVALAALIAGASALAARALAALIALAAPAEIRLQQVRERVHVAQLAVLDPEEVRIRSTAAAGRSAGPERAERDDRADHLVDDEAPVRDVHPARHADLAAVVRGAAARVHAAFDADAGEAPGHEVDLPLEERVEVRIGRGDQG